MDPETVISAVTAAVSLGQRIVALFGATSNANDPTVLGIQKILTELEDLKATVIQGIANLEEFLKGIRDDIELYTASTQANALLAIAEGIGQSVSDPGVHLADIRQRLRDQMRTYFSYEKASGCAFFAYLPRIQRIFLVEYDLARRTKDATWDAQVAAYKACIVGAIGEHDTTTPGCWGYSQEVIAQGDTGYNKLAEYVINTPDGEPSRRPAYNRTIKLWEIIVRLRDAKEVAHEFLDMI